MLTWVMIFSRPGLSADVDRYLTDIWVDMGPVSSGNNFTHLRLCKD